MNRFPEPTRNEHLCWFGAATLLGGVMGTGIALTSGSSWSDFPYLSLLILWPLLFIHFVFVLFISDRFERRDHCSSIVGVLYVSMVAAFVAARGTLITGGLGTIYAVVIMVFMIGLLSLVGNSSMYVARKWYRNRNSPGRHCEECKYDLTGNVTGRCPECGNSIG